MRIVVFKETGDRPRIKILKVSNSRSHQQKMMCFKYSDFTLLGEIHIDNKLVRQMKRKELPYSFLRNTAIDSCKISNCEFCEHGYPSFFLMEDTLISALKCGGQK